MRFISILLLNFLIGCATSAGLLRLQDRELLIHPDKPALAYPHNVEDCRERKWPFRWLGDKCKTKHVIDIYDMNKKEDRKTLIDAGFTCKSKMRFKY